MSPWKLLVALLLVVPPVAYVAQDLSTDPQTPTARAAIVLPDDPTPTSTSTEPSRSPEPEPTRDPRPSTVSDPDDCDDDERDDGVLVVHPCPDDVGDDEQDDDDRDGGRDDD